MPPTVCDASAVELDQTPVSPQPDGPRLSGEAAAAEDRNFLVLATYLVVVRTGWIFKTESIVMPAVLDTITGGGPMGGFLRGFLPVLNRLSHSIPPMLFSRRLKVLPQKRRVVLTTTTVMAAIFLLLAAVWWQLAGRVPGWLPVFFLVAYVSFFCATGINNLAVDTLQGKLVPVTRRGRLLLVANVVGATTAIVAVAVLMPLWLTAEGGRFEMIFGFTGLCFAAAVLLLLMLKEPRDRFDEPGRGVRQLLGSAWELLRSDASFRRLAWVAMTFSCSMLLFPHYQSLGRRAPLSLTFDNLLIWLIVQNVGTALFSLVAGPIADRRGNRLALRLVMLGICSMPIVAIGLSHWAAWGATLFPGVFLFIGLMPVGFKTFNNYTLELCDAEDHPRYLSTLGLCFALPLLVSPAVGWVVEATSFEAVFLAVSCILVVGWLLTFRLSEPRHAIQVAALAEVVPEDD